ncbi:unnamed protein product [Calypogeia fissa]
MSRLSSSMSVRRAVCVGLTVVTCLLSVLQVAVADQGASTFGRPNLGSNGGPEFLNSGSVSEKFLEQNGDSSTTTSSMESLSWVEIGHELFHRVFQLAEESREWPELKFGWRTVTALILGGIGAAMSSAGGIGGGGLFVPLFNLLLEFDAKTSAALSNFMILGGSLANLYINLQQHHPTLPHKPLIDFDVVMLLQPNLLLGISTGVILNVVLPDWVIIALLAVTLSYMTILSYKSALSRWKKESKQNSLQRKTPSPLPNGESFHADRSNGGDIPSQAGDQNGAQNSTTGTAGRGDEENPKAASISCYGVGMEDHALSEPLLPVEEKLQGARSVLPMDKVMGLAVTWVAFFAVQVLRGGENSLSILGIPSCGWAYWLLTVTQVPLALGLTAWTVIRLHAAHPSKEDPEAIQEDDFVLKPESCTLFAWIALVAGLLGGLLGIGGGMIINPMFLAVGMVPQVTAGTCASMVFFSSSMSVVQFWLMGRVPVGYAVTVALLCFVFSSVGVTLVHKAIDRYNRASLIVFSVATVMGVSAMLMAGFGGLSAYQKFESGAYMGFHYPC